MRALMSLLLFSALISATELGLPVDCELGNDCVIQYYVDVDTSAGATDFQCKHLAYDGHKGTDFRVVDPNNHMMPVLAAADGIVMNTRNHMSDNFDHYDDSISDNIACGNGAIIDHQNGLKTQYCHLKQGSVIVQKNQRIKKGDMIGLVGQSGRSNFLHLHFSVRRNDIIIDPFTNMDQQSGCGQPISDSLWESPVKNYKPTLIYDSGFSANRPFKAIHGSQPIARYEPILFYWIKLIGIEKGDRIVANVVNDEGAVVAEYNTDVKKDWRHYFFYFGYENKTQKPLSGQYSGDIKIMRDSKAIESHQIDTLFIN